MNYFFFRLLNRKLFRNNLGIIIDDWSKFNQKDLFESKQFIINNRYDFCMENEIEKSDFNIEKEKEKWNRNWNWKEARLKKRNIFLS